MPTLAVEVSFLLFLLRTSVCVNRPVSSDPLTYISFAAGVLSWHERTVTQPLVDDVCLINAMSDEEYANFADGVPANEVAPSPTLAFAPAPTCGSGPTVCVDFPQEASSIAIATMLRAPASPADRQTERPRGPLANPARTRSRILCMGGFLLLRELLSGSRGHRPTGGHLSGAPRDSTDDACALMRCARHEIDDGASACGVKPMCRRIEPDIRGLRRSVCISAGAFRGREALMTSSVRRTRQPGLWL